jgi:hypothetical protein
MGGVSIDTAAPQPRELDIVFQGGQGFLDRIAAIANAREAHDRAARNADRRMAEAEAREKQADAIIAAANAHAAELARLTEASRKELEDDRRTHEQQVSQHAAAHAAKLAELEKDQQAARAAKLTADRRQAELDAKFEKINAALTGF